MSIIEPKKEAEEQHSELRDLIVKAFSTAEYPSDDNIVPGKFPPEMPDYEEIYTHYKSKRWQDLDSDFFYSSGSLPFSIGFLTDRAFLYYLPAFMIHLADPGWNGSTSVLMEDILEKLSPCNGSISRYAPFEFDAMQLKAVASFLSYISSEIDRYGPSFADMARELSVFYGQSRSGSPSDHPTSSE